jgi:AcrR family transcriptional regulator
MKTTDLGQSTEPTANGSEGRKATRPRNLYGQSIGRKGAETRERLLKATIELLEKRSLRDVSVADITALAGTSSSGFYIYFSDVAAAALAVAETIFQITPEIEVLLGKEWTAGDAKANAYSLVNSYVNFTRQHHAILRVRNLAADEGDRRFEDARHNAVARIHELLTARIAAADNGLDPSSGASAVLALMERISAISRLPLRLHHSRPKLIASAAFMVASALAPTDPTTT